jgi:hypothetical protein
VCWGPIKVVVRGVGVQCEWVLVVLQVVCTACLAAGEGMAVALLLAGSGRTCMKLGTPVPALPLVGGFVVVVAALSWWPCGVACGVALPGCCVPLLFRVGVLRQLRRAGTLACHVLASLARVYLACASGCSHG